jgi:hypothetical protein
MEIKTSLKTILLTSKIPSAFDQFLQFLTYLEESISLPKKKMTT